MEKFMLIQVFSLLTCFSSVGSPFMELGNSWSLVYNFVTMKSTFHFWKCIIYLIFLEVGIMVRNASSALTEKLVGWLGLSSLFHEVGRSSDHLFSHFLYVFPLSFIGSKPESSEIITSLFMRGYEWFVDYWMHLFMFSNSTRQSVKAVAVQEAQFFGEKKSVLWKLFPERSFESYVDYRVVRRVIP